MLGSLVMDLSVGNVECGTSYVCQLMPPMNNAYTTYSRTMDILFILICKVR